MRHNC